MNLARTSLSVLIAAGAALTLSTAFAQTAPAPTQGDAMQSAPSTQAAPAAAPKQVTWADLDSDKDGNLSKQEVSPVPSLTQVFDQADANKDGKLTADEYKSFAASNTPGATGSSSGSGSGQ